LRSLSKSLCGRGFRGSRFLHTFVIDNLGEMVSIMAILSTQCAREIGVKVVVLSLSWLGIGSTRIWVLSTHIRIPPDL